jgi:hypothetical protein
MQLFILCKQLVFGFLVGLVGYAGIYRADLFAFGRIVGSHTLSASIRVDYVDFLAFGNRLVGAFGLAGAATDALIGNLIGHFSSS